MITPTVGRKVWYQPLSFERKFPHTQPFDATITHVWNDECVNLYILTEDGFAIRKTNVVLAQGRGAQPGEAEWMPYQIGQAKKSETPPTEKVAPLGD